MMARVIGHVPGIGMQGRALEKQRLGSCLVCHFLTEYLTDVGTPRFRCQYLIEDRAADQYQQLARYV